MFGTNLIGLMGLDRFSKPIRSEWEVKWSTYPLTAPAVKPLTM
jgi:hypothetical protein